MPTVKLNKKIFEQLIGKKLPLDELKDRISMLGTDLEGIKGNEINVEIFPDRPDMLSEQGFARAFSAFIGLKTGLKKYDVEPSGEKVIIDKSVADIRPFTACALVKNMKFTDERIIELIQIQEKLHVTFGRNRKKVAIGIYPLEHIKLPISFRGEDPKNIIFQPLESTKEMTGIQILSGHPTGRDYGHLLEGLKKFPVFRDADGEVLSMPPIINSHKTGKIDENTKEVFIECSGFDLYSLKKCLNIIVTAMADMGGKIYSMELEYQDTKVVTPDLDPDDMDVDIDYINRKLGLELKENDVKRFLEKMGYDYKDRKAFIPAYRADIIHPVDIVEDIAIAYGYENFAEEIPNVMTIGQENQLGIFTNKIKEILVGLGLLEVNTYHIASKYSQTSLMNCNIELVELQNALNEEFNVMRAWILPSLMEIYNDNKHNEYPQDIFNIGTVFKKDDTKETNVAEHTRLGVSLCSDESDFTKIKQVLDFLMNQLGIDYQSKDAEHGSFIPGRVARVSVKGKEVAYIGEIAPEVLENFDIQMPVAAFELNLTVLFEVMER